MTRIMQSKSFALDSTGNGAVYVLSNLAAYRDVCLQGDDALTFEADLASIEAACPEWSAECVLAWLWDECDYGGASNEWLR